VYSGPLLREAWVSADKCGGRAEGGAMRRAARASGLVAGAACVIVLASGAGPAAGASRSAVRGVAERPLIATVTVSPTSGPGGTDVLVTGQGFSNSGCPITIVFRDVNHVSTMVGSANGASFETSITIPSGAAIGVGGIRASQRVPRYPYRQCLYKGPAGSAPFTVTS